MDSSNWITHLRKEELLHELKHFGISADEKSSRDVLRGQYRKVISMCRRGSIKPDDFKSPDAESEVKCCYEPVCDLETIHESLIPGDTVTIKRLTARSQYYLMRLSRVTLPNNDLTQLKTKLINIIASHHDDSDDEEMQTPRQTSPARETVETSKLVYVKEKSINLSSLNLKFDGTSCVRVFIERLEELRQARGISEQLALVAFSDLLEKSALCWFRSNKNSFKTYSDLLAGLREDFDIPDLDYKLTKEIRARTQAKTESIVAYLSIMQGMISRLTKPLSEEEQLDIIMHNIRPEYMREMALLDISSIKQLQIYGKKLELARARQDQFVEPKPSDLKQDFNFYTKDKPSPSSQKTSKPISAVEKLSTSVNNKKCFRCNRTNHYTNECKVSKELVCYKCGEKGFKRTDCPKCPKN